MVKHIVFWKLKDEAGGRSKAENALAVKERLEALAGKVPGLLKIEVGIDISREEGSCDLALYSEFVSRGSLAAYQEHPDHKAVMPLIMEARAERRVVDYET
jgi:hypothetical protein